MFSRADAPTRRTRTRSIASVAALVAASAFVLVSVVDPSAPTYAEDRGLESVPGIQQGVSDISGSGEVIGRDAFVVESPAPVVTETPEPSVAEEPEVAEAAEVAEAPAEEPAPSVELPVAAAPDPGSAQGIAREMVLARGWGEGEYSCLYNLWQRESNWNVYAHNASSGAYGIPQSLPGSKMASAGADWQTNPATQITWGLGYIEGRYGTPCAAWGHSESVGWY